MKSWIRQQLKNLDTIAELSPAVANDLRDILHEAEHKAAKAGLPDAVKACQIREGGVGIGLARVILARCLEAANGSKTEEKPTNGPFSVKEAAKLLRISQRKLYQDIEAGLIEHQQHPIRISAAALEDYNRHRQKRSVMPGSFRNLR